MTATIERKYAMTRLGPGDYLLPSNDLTVTWRIHTHIDGRNLGLVCNYDERTFWRLVWMPLEQVRELTEMTDPWDSMWTEVEWHLPSRKAAVDLAMKHDARRMNQ